jgi:hypothetical protein
LNTVPFLISEFSIPSLAALIKEVFGAKAPDIKEKRQVIYIFNYLKGLNARSIICETEYIDRDFLIDHQYYLTRAFHKYPNRCARLHFFSDDIDTLEFKELIKNPLESSIKDLQGSYLGYCVIKPLPVTFIWKTCLKVYPDHEREFISKPQKSNLFGIPLQVSSIPFQEQDKTVSACATTALWSVFHATPCFERTSVPPPSQITLSALNGELEATNSFPSKGLSDKQLIKALDSFNLKHHDYKLGENSLSAQEEAKVINTYLSSGFPILATTKVISKNNDGDLELKGNHAVTLVGMTLHKNGTIDNLYMHDDRVGAYVKTIRLDENLTYLDLESGVKNTHSSSFYKMHIDDHEKDKFDEIYILDAIKVGTYHKVRVPLNYIFFTAKYLIEIYEKALPEELRGSPDFDFDFEIRLEESNSLKSDYLTSSSLVNKEGILFTSLPKYVWLVKYKFKNTVGEESAEILDLIFDSTDIPLGNPLLAIAIFNQEPSTYFITQISSNAIASSRNSDHLIESFTLATTRNLIPKEKEYFSELNSLFGKLNAPAYVKAQELDMHEDSFVEITLSAENSLDEFYDKFMLLVEGGSDKHPIWVISKNGTLILGKDYGHTTLTKSSPARIAGDIVKTEGGFTITPKSGRYAQQYVGTEKTTYMKNVLIKFNSIFQGEHIEIAD